MIRLWVPDDLAAGAALEPSREQAHYLVNVMRLAPGADLALFNGRDGEWRGTLTEVSKRGCRLAVGARLRPQQAAPDLDLIVALVKRTRLETIVEKAAELGARRVRLAITERTNADHAKVARLQAIAIEAAEQTGRLDVPQVMEPQKLPALLADLGEDRRLLFCDEAGEALPAQTALAGAGGEAWAILIGPEGGFSPAERQAIRALPAATPVSLGPRILRADTAAISAMTLWQSALGDWRV
ncbi:16S rRNA (uracil(1498)-N(3))-methyltransferase [Caulobacter sp. KR2-114]|uniref:16S rRNA (uracil(1498)-N(3))-methyltransferase n=1 Tax=Caulobacter sp. KR2-114 TaxID=3400912 RepID=UPI003BFD0BDF